MTATATIGPDKVELRKISMDAPWRWLAAGSRDMMRYPLISLGYGLAFVAFGLLITGGLWRIGLSSMIPIAVSAFVLFGPLLAVGLYELSRRLDENEPVTLKDIVLVKTKEPIQLAYLGFFLMGGFLVWARIAQTLFAYFVFGGYPTLAEFTAFILTTPSGLALASIGTIVGGLIAFVIYAFTVISVPLLMRREVDVITAVIASVNTVKNNLGPMLLWAWIIAVVVAVGSALAIIGLALAFPLLGHATWHAYRDAVVAKV